MVIQSRSGNIMEVLGRLTLTSEERLFPDGLFLADTAGGQRAVEAKYIQDWSTSPYNPDPSKPYESNDAVAKVVEQALKYSQAYPAGVRWVTNSHEFIDEYTRRFDEAGIKNYTFVRIPTVKEEGNGSNSH